jgi:hypothetical protein
VKPSNRRLGTDRSATTALDRRSAMPVLRLALALLPVACGGDGGRTAASDSGAPATAIMRDSTSAVASATSSASDSAPATTGAGTDDAAAMALRLPGSLLGTLQIFDTTVTAAGDTVVALGGAVLDPGGRADYSIGHYRINGAHVLRVEAVRGREPDGRARTEVRSALQLPALLGGEDVLLGDCSRGATVDPLLIAIARTDQASGAQTVRRAWRFDRASERLVTADTARVSCAVPGT